MENKEQEELQIKLIENFHRNLNFIKKKDQKLFDKICILNDAIEKGFYNERFHLDFLDDEREFDIFDNETGCYIYNKKSKDILNNLINQINFECKQVFSINNNKLFGINNFDIELKTNEKYDVLDSILFKNLSNYYKILGEKKGNFYQEVDKFIFLGTHLGLHLPKIVEKINSKSYIIYEPNLEIFRLSLFTVDYRIFDKLDILFIVMEEDDFNGKIEKFLYTNPYSNYNIKYSRVNYISDKDIDKFLTKFHASKSSYFDYTKMLYDIIYSFTKNISKKRRFLELKNNEFYIDTPVLYVGAGPSLSKNIEWLKQNQEKFIIVAMGATYKKLIDNFIRVDIIITVDPKYSILSRTHFKEENFTFLKDKIILASTNTPQKILNKFNQNKLFLYETLIPFKQNSNCYFGASVGEIGLSLILDLNFKNIYLLGIDLTIDLATRNTHFDGYENNKNEKIKLDNAQTIGDLDSQILSVINNNFENSFTTRMFALSIDKYKDIIKERKKNWQYIYSLSEKAAFIKGIEYINKEDLELINYYDLDKQNFIIYKLLRDKSIDKLNVFEKRILKKSINFLNKLDLKIYFRFKTLNDFKDELYTFKKVMIKNNDNFLNLVLGNYFDMVLPYIFDCFNTLNFNIESETLNKLRVEFIKQVKKIIDDYVYMMNQIKE